jgi:carboxylesterase
MSQDQQFTLNNEPFYWAGLPEIKPDHAVLLLHGLGGGTYEMRPIGERLHVHGYSVKGINYPGHDQPAARMPKSVWQDWYAHAEAAYQELAQSHRHISLVGFSTGCPLALKLAHQHEVDRLVLLSPFLEIKRFWRLPVEPLVHPVSRWLEHLPRVRLPIKDRQLRKHAEAVAFVASFNLRTVCSALELIQEVKLIVPEIKNRTLIIQSPLDHVVDPRGAEYLMTHLGSSDKALHWLKTSNHIISLDVEREEVFSKVVAFLLD